MGHGRRIHGVRNKWRAKVAPAEAYSLEDVVDPITEELQALRLFRDGLLKPMDGTGTFNFN